MNLIYSKLNAIFIVLFTLIFTSSCSLYDRVIYHQNLYQGNYLTKTEVNQIHIGMTQQQVSNILGTPMFKDQSNTWYYIALCKIPHQSLIQKRLLLSFNTNGILTHIDKLTDF